jgi:hypothetical protein
MNSTDKIGSDLLKYVKFDYSKVVPNTYNISLTPAEKEFSSEIARVIEIIYI